MIIPDIYKNENQGDDKQFLDENGFAILDGIYSKTEIAKIEKLLAQIDTDNPLFRKTADLFAIRQFVKEIPEIKAVLFNENLLQVIRKIGGDDYFLIKSIYFDKPEKSNWFVAYHQDLTISINEKKESKEFKNWTKKHNQFAVQPPAEILENIFTIRIHLDDTNAENGALKIIPKSHKYGVQRIENIDLNVENEIFCNIASGGVMIMKPLLFHASNKTTNDKNRRVIHLEFSNKILPNEIKFSEYQAIFS